ncbi:MAG: hypothetical protein H6719_29595 [Sandaracinaceae bacterium]|nr:hypothetical protein [Sandaracinaceae bacterium]
MAVTLTLAVGSVLLMVCGFTWAARREELLAVARLEKLKVMPLADAAPGEPCAARGEVVGETTVSDPVTDEPAVWFEARLVRRDRGEELWAKTEGASLRLDDGSGPVAVVELVGAEIAIGARDVEEHDRVPSERMRAILTSIEATPPTEAPTARYVIEHRAIRVGDELTLVGVPVRDGDELRFASTGPLHLTPEPLATLQGRLRADLGAMDTMLRIGVGLGITLIGLGIGLVLWLG